MATIKPVQPFTPDVDAKALRKAMKGLGTDEATLINILCARTAHQRSEIRTQYKQMHGRDLIEDLTKEISGNFRVVMLGLMTPLDEYLAAEIKAAIKGIGTDEDILIEVLCTRTNAEIRAIKDAFQRLYGQDMEEEVCGDLSGHLKRMMSALMTARRPENTGIDIRKAQREAKELLDAGVNQWGTDEEAFIAVFCSNSFEQLRATFHEYRNLAGHDIMEAIERETSGDLKTAMLTIVKSVFNTHLYFAERLHKAMKGLGTDDTTLIRIIVSRCEIDLAHIRGEYMRVYESSLEHDIKKETSGDFQTALMVMVRQN
ncbi:annexin A13 [Galendromus occidentalis]|uniref:Annexin n=1 Tax=Galendromus occidentalis TaxID=34638 RepID=A0AAJ6QVJ3_9ACAR|nr:annexin A13 [Galendromus occidentalis]